MLSASSFQLLPYTREQLPAPHRELQLFIGADAYRHGTIWALASSRGDLVDLRRDTLQFMVTLRDVEPLVWRRIEVPARYSFWDLHVAIQDAMGWLDYHLHMFRIRNVGGEIEEIGIPNEDTFEGEPVCRPGWELAVAAYFTRVGTRAEYEYDFGDGWVHDVLLESIAPRRARTRYPRCIAGARRCPPEDCGGPHGYAELLATIADPTHEEYESTVEWLGGVIDPQAFDPSAVRFDNPAQRWKITFAGG